MTIIPDWLKPYTDSISTGVTVGTIMDYLPYIAAVFATVYWVIRIYETNTVQYILFRFINRGKPDED